MANLQLVMMASNLYGTCFQLSGSSLIHDSVMVDDLLHYDLPVQEHLL